MVNIKDFDSNRQEVIQKHCYLLHWTYRKKHKHQINSVNPLYLIFVK